MKIQSPGEAKLKGKDINTLIISVLKLQNLNMLDTHRHLKIGDYSSIFFYTFLIIFINKVILSDMEISKPYSVMS